MIHKKLIGAFMIALSFFLTIEMATAKSAGKNQVWEVAKKVYRFGPAEGNNGY